MPEPTAEDRHADPNKYYKWMRRREAAREGMVAALEKINRWSRINDPTEVGRVEVGRVARVALKEYEEANK